MTKSKKFKRRIRDRIRHTGESYCAARNILLGRHNRSTGHRAEVIAIAGMKGGIGRSTLAILMASEMHLRGERVLLVSLQPAERPFGEPKPFLTTVQHWGLRVEKSGLGGPDSVAIQEKMLLSWEFGELVSRYSLVIVDCPRVLEIQYAAMMWADRVLIPCSTASLVASAMDDALALVEYGQRQNQGLVGRIVVAMECPRTRARRIAALREAANECGVKVAESMLRYRVAFMGCLNSGRPLSRYAPGSKALAEVVSLLDELFPAGRPAQPDMWKAGDVLPRMKSIGKEVLVVPKGTKNFYRAYAARAELPSPSSRVKRRP